MRTALQDHDRCSHRIHRLSSAAGHLVGEQLIKIPGEAYQLPAPRSARQDAIA
jgi:hypothetical protein